MNTFNNKKVILGAVLLALVISIPITLSQLSKPQQQQSHAAANGSTKLSFTPVSSQSNPIKANVGSTVDLNLFVNPGKNNVSFIRYQVKFDSSKIQLAKNPVDLTTNFTSIEGPIADGGSVSQSVTVGADPTKVITKTTKVATLHFTAIASGQTSVTFSTVSQALSAGSNDQASQNVLATTTPAFLEIGDGGGSPTPEPSGAGTALNFTLLLHGVGAAGDNPNPDSTLSNKNPLHPARPLHVEVYDTNNQLVASASAPITYDSASGIFQGEVSLPDNVTSGDYSVKIQTDRYLRKLVPGIQQITSGQATQVPSTQMVTGDTNNDNVLDVLDYNALLDCGYGQLNPLPMNDPNSLFNSSTCKVHIPTEDIDLNDDGVVNSIDYNLFLRELSVQTGD